MTNELAEKPMSYEEMIDTLKGLVFGTFDRTTSKEREALGRAIDLLSNSGEDCISRARVVEWLEKCTDDSIEHAINTNLEFIPPVIPKPKTDVLGKIRAEIEQTAEDYDKFGDCRFIRGLWIALGIIDKYKTESEDKE